MATTGDPYQAYSASLSALGNQTTGMWTNPQSALGNLVTREEVAEQIDEALKTRVHINVAKDQENRICELEEAVGKLIKANEELAKEKQMLQI